MALQIKVTTAAAAADAALLAQHVISRAISRSDSGANKALANTVEAYALGTGFTFGTLKAFSIQPALDTAVDAFIAAVADVDARAAVQAIVTAIRTAQDTHQTANASLYTGSNPIDVWFKNAAPSLNTDLDAAIAGATVSASEVAVTLSSISNFEGSVINYIAGL